jgi:hypothetical protein
METDVKTKLLDHPSFLRWALLADAGISGATGLLMSLGAGLLEGLLGVPAALLRYAGVSLLPFSAFVAYVATREQLPPPGVRVVIACNALWAAASILLLPSGWIAPTLLGHAYIVAQAVGVAMFGVLQYVGLRRRVASIA